MIPKKDKYRYANSPQIAINGYFVEACRTGNMELVRYFLLDTRIKKAEIDFQNYNAIFRACEKKHNEIVKFLLNGKELEKTVSINMRNGALLHAAIVHDNFELVDYLLKEKQNKRLKLNQNNDEIFKYLMGNFISKRETIRKLIIDYDLEKTQEITDFLDEKNRNVEQKQLVNEWFETREFAKTMQLVFEDDANKKQTENKLKRNKI